MKNPERNQLWLQAVARKGFVATKYSKLCSVHFDKTCFYSQPGGSYRLRLNDNAAPTLFPSSFSMTNRSPSKRPQHTSMILQENCEEEIHNNNESKFIEI